MAVGNLARNLIASFFNVAGRKTIKEVYIFLKCQNLFRTYNKLTRPHIVGNYKKNFAYPTICYLGSAPNAPSASAKCKSLGQPSRFFQKPKILVRVLAAIMIPVDEIGSSKDTMGQTATSEIKLGKYLTFCK